MSYNSGLNINKKQKSFAETSKDFGEMLAFFRLYPDYFIDYISTEKTPIKLFPYQRMFLRAMFRHQKTGIVATRGIAKSFLNILSKYLKCIFYPRITISIVAPTKGQAIKIMQQKIFEIWEVFPILRNEIRKDEIQKDYIRLTFRNGSVLDVIVMSEGSRGLRANEISFEEICDEKTDPKIINEVILPTMAINRRRADGTVDKDEIGKVEVYITTASTKQQYCYQKIMEIFSEMVSGKRSFLIGSDYIMPCFHNLLDIDSISSKKDSPTYNPLSFDREKSKYSPYVEKSA